MGEALDMLNEARDDLFNSGHPETCYLMPARQEIQVIIEPIPTEFIAFAVDQKTRPMANLLVSKAEPKGAFVTKGSIIYCPALRSNYRVTEPDTEASELVYTFVAEASPA